MNLEEINTDLSPRNLAVMRQANGKFSIYKIERGAANGFDRYVRTGKAFETLEAAVASLMRRAA
jgi:hypothetical protein